MDYWAQLRESEIQDKKLFLDRIQAFERLAIGDSIKRGTDNNIFTIVAIEQIDRYERSVYWSIDIDETEGIDREEWVMQDWDLLKYN